MTKQFLKVREEWDSIPIMVIKIIGCLLLGSVLQGMMMSEPAPQSVWVIPLILIGLMVIIFIVGYSDRKTYFEEIK